MLPGYIDFHVDSIADFLTRTNSGYVVVHECGIRASDATLAQYDRMHHANELHENVRAELLRLWHSALNDIIDSCRERQAIIDTEIAKGLGDA